MNSLRKFNGEYSYDVKLLSYPILKKRLISLIGKKRYEYMKTTWAVEGGIMVENDILEAAGCEAHNCDMTNFIIVIDLKKDILYVGYMVEGEIKKFGETDGFPEQLLQWEQENIKSKNETYSKLVKRNIKYLIYNNYGKSSSKKRTFLVRFVKTQNYDN